jgi:hypothetical protein
MYRAPTSDAGDLLQWATSGGSAARGWRVRGVAQGPNCHEIVKNVNGPTSDEL